MAEPREGRPLLPPGTGMEGGGLAGRGGGEAELRVSEGRGRWEGTSAPLLGSLCLGGARSCYKRFKFLKGLEKRVVALSDPPS